MKPVYVATAFTINSIVRELDFLSSEIFTTKYQHHSWLIRQQITVEIVANRKALSTIRNKKKRTERLDNHCW